MALIRSLPTAHLSNFKRQVRPYEPDLSFHLRLRRMFYCEPQQTMDKVKTSIGPTERCEGVEFEAVAVLSSPGPLGVISMGTLPLSLIAIGWTRRRNLDDALTSGTRFGR